MGCGGGIVAAGSVLFMGGGWERLSAEGLYSLGQCPDNCVSVETAVLQMDMELIGARQHDVAARN